MFANLWLYVGAEFGSLIQFAEVVPDHSNPDRQEELKLRQRNQLLGWIVIWILMHRFLTHTDPSLGWHKSQRLTHPVSNARNMPIILSFFDRKRLLMQCRPLNLGTFAQ